MSGYMRFDTARAVENVVWQMRLADFPRAENRALINDLANGAPPYSQEEQVQNRITTNVNYLELANICHSARRQFTNAFLNVDPPYTVKVDLGPPWKRREYSQTVSDELKKIHKRSLRYFEMRRQVFASNVLHGIGPSVYNNPDSWCPTMIGVEDVLVPSETLVSFENLPFFAVFRQYTAMQLWKLTQTGKVDPAWNMDVVKKAIKWADDESRLLMGSSWPEFWSPEKMHERIKSDGAMYASDVVPTIDVYDVFFWNDDGKKSGWNRRVVLDAWGDPGPGIGGGGGYAPQMPNKSKIGTRGEFLYNSGDRVYADKLSEIIHWQLADCSCVAPFRYHSIRSLGFLLYSVCHLQNRLRCKFNDSVFEALLQYFRVANPQDAERLTQVDLIDKGIIPEGLEFVKAGERWQVNEALAERAMQLNRQTMADNSASFTQDYDFAQEDKKNETATRTMAKVTSTAALVGAMLSQAYKYEEFRYQEEARRFCRKNSKDVEVRTFRVNCLHKGVPEEALDSDRWEIIPKKIIGSGDKQLQIIIAEALMKVRALLEPSAQKEVDRIYISAYTEDYDLTAELVPMVKGPSKSAELASFAAGALMQTLDVEVVEGIDRPNYIETLLARMSAAIQQIEQDGGNADLKQIRGLDKMGQHITQQILILAQNPQEKATVKQYGDDLKNLGNLLKAYKQRLQEQMQQQQQQQGAQMDPKDAAKIQAMIMMAQAKAQNTRESHAQRTAQRQIQFEQKMLQDADKHQSDLAKRDLEHLHAVGEKERETQSAIRLNRLRTVEA